MLRYSRLAPGAISVVAISLVLTSACSSASTTPAPYAPPSGDRVTEQVNGSCPTPSSVLRGTKPTGDVCTEGADCAPICCPCSNGTNREWLAVHCKSGVCVGAPDVCTDTADPTLCQAP